jgi:hypothetical protein
MVTPSFLRAGLHVAPRDLFTPLTVTPAGVLDRVVSPELPLKDIVFPGVDEVARTVGMAGRRRAPIPGPTERPISFKAYVGKVTCTCPLCGHVEVEREYEEEGSDSIIANFGGDVILCHDSDRLFRESFPTQLLFFCDNHASRTELLSA